MDLTITDKVVQLFKDKDSRKKHYRELYEKHEFLKAYAMHTDHARADNPKGRDRARGRVGEARRAATFIPDRRRNASRLPVAGCWLWRWALARRRSCHT